MKLPKKIAGGKIIKAGKARRVMTELGPAIVMNNVTVKLDPLYREGETVWLKAIPGSHYYLCDRDESLKERQKPCKHEEGCAIRVLEDPQPRQKAKLLEEVRS